MDKIKAFWRILLMIGVLLFGLLVIWFVIGFSSGFKYGGEAKVEDQSENVEGFGFLYEYSNESLSIQNEEGELYTYSLDDNSRFGVKNPIDGSTIDSSVADLKIGSPVVYSATDNVLVELVSDVVTTISGVVVLNNGIQIEVDNYNDEIVQINVDEDTQVFIAGDENVYSVSDLIVGDEVIVYSLDYLGEDFEISAVAIEKINYDLLEVTNLE